MESIAQILVSLGAVAILAAAVGGGVRALGNEIPLISSPTRQVALAFAGISLIGAGMWQGGRTSRAAAPAATSTPVQAIPRIEIEPLPSVDFRSSEPRDTLSVKKGRGYLLVTTTVGLRNPTREPMIARITGATLQLDGAQIPFRPYYFTTLGNEPEPWLGTDSTIAGPLAIKPTDVNSREIMFIPVDAGGGMYRWSSFLRAVLEKNDLNPVFTVTVAPAVEAATGQAISTACKARIDKLIGDVREKVKQELSSVWITAACAN